MHLPLPQDQTLQWRPQPLIIAIVVLLIATTGCTAGGTSGPPAAALRSTPTPDIVSLIDPAARCYIDAVNSRDPDALAACFTEDSVVVDINQRITGPDAIRRWSQNRLMGGHLKVLKEQSYDGGMIVLVHWAPHSTAGWLVWYRFEYMGGRLTLVDLQNA